MGIEVESYRTIDEVLRALDKGRFDTFLMIVKGDKEDIKQIEKLSVVRKIDGDLPVVLISEGDSIDIEKSARLQGVFYYFVEPVNIKELKEVLRESARIRLRRAERGIR
jgi:DNA-binding NtrC family response regulator